MEALRASGLAHILAISGLHMALVAGTFFYFVRACFSLFPSLVQALPVKKIAAGGALAVATVYLVISGASVSTQRAFIMLAIMLMIAILLDRRALTMRNVALAAILIILFTAVRRGRPWISDVVCGNGCADRHLHAVGPEAPGHDSNRQDARYRFLLRGDHVLCRPGGHIHRGRHGDRTVCHSFHFHRIAPFGVLANLAAMPIVTFVVMPAGLFSLLAMPIGLEHWPLIVMGKGLDAVIAIARYVEDLGGAIGGRSDQCCAAWRDGRRISYLCVDADATAVDRYSADGRCRSYWLQPALPGRVPDLLVSEDGRLVAVVSGKSLATNRKTPPKFIFEQWQRSLGGAIHIGPERIEHTAASSGGSLGFPHLFEANLEGQTVDSRVSMRPQDSYCVCYRSANGANGSSIVEDLVMIGHGV